MRLYTFSIETPLGAVQRIGAEADGRLVDLNAAAGAFLEAEGEPDAAEYADFLVPPAMIPFLERGEKARRAAASALQAAAEGEAGPTGARLTYGFDEVHIEAPVPRPNIVWDGMVFLEHVKMGRDVIPDVFYEKPPYFTQSAAVVAGPYDPAAKLGEL